MRKQIFRHGSKRAGFTLIELLVVIAIIGLLSTLAVVALNNARMKARDAKRVSDIKQIQTALELYYNDCNSYPDGTAAGQEVDANTDLTGPAACGTVTYMATVPSNPTPVDTGCTGSIYTYTQTSSGASYTLAYCLGGITGGVPAGVRTASPAGIR
ncbi:MAG: prepilin-type N-terminal cleavage/methylation domain-containing protein [bacterium]|nr:prepilin-type N-terminal cleavage/methylation domain-containing protein [bacterium]